MYLSSEFQYIIYRDKEIVDDNYVYSRKNAFYNHIKDTKESKKLKEDSFPKKFKKYL